MAAAARIRCCISAAVRVTGWNQPLLSGGEDAFRLARAWSAQVTEPLAWAAL